MMGNVVVWKPSDSQVFSAKVIVDVFAEAGLPAGVINVVYGDPVMITETVLASPDFSGIHFYGIYPCVQGTVEADRQQHPHL